MINLGTEQITWERHQLGEGHWMGTSQVPGKLFLSQEQFEKVWLSQPEDYHVILMHGKPVKTPRKQQAFGADYHYTGRVNQALPVPDWLQPMMSWAKEQIDKRLNGALVNYYDGALGHYIGQHHDSTINMIFGAPIITVSYGEERIFRLTKEEGRGKEKHLIATRDFLALPGNVFSIPYETNLVWKHGVPHFARYKGRRISITFRAFHQD